MRSSLGTSHRLLSLIGGSQIQLHVSTPLVAEYDEILQRELPHISYQGVVDYLCQVAVKSQATIVTWNVKDFKAADKFGIQVITPKQLLIELGVAS